jgi:hypothetical protein
VRRPAQNSFDYEAGTMTKTDFYACAVAELAGCDSLIFNPAGGSATDFAPGPAWPDSGAWALEPELCDQFDLVLAGPASDGPQGADDPEDGG